MSNTFYLIIAIAVIAIVTLLTRAVPFLIFGKRELPQLIKYMGNVLPPAIMIILVCYCLKSVKFATLSNWLPEFIACLIVAIVHKLKNNLYLSIIVGTLAYMIIIRLI